MTVALVTGSSRGIGRAIAERLGADGASVLVNYHSNEAAAREVVASIKAVGGEAVAAQADVADPKQLIGLYDVVEREFGGVDIVVSNVGTAEFAPVVDTTDEEFDTMFATNAKAGFIALREAGRRVRDGGRIVSISAGVTRTYRPNSGVYGASKAAVEHLVQVLGRELGPRRVTVNAVLPGAVRTDALAAGMPPEAWATMAAETPLGRIGEPSDIADVVAFLASDQARWITGQCLAAGGGVF